MIQINNKTSCCGCTACQSICPHNAIEMIPDELGFMYPVVDKDKCIDCGLCDKVCQFHPGYNRYSNFDTPLVYGARHKETEELSKSQSGAAFYALAKNFIAQGCVVYGVGYDNPKHIIHKRVTSIPELEELRGSKYVQSDIRGIYSSIKTDLKQGNKVLFTGTPCQVAGLKSFIPNSLHSNLYTIDLVCHAVPSPAIWASYVDWMEKKYKSKVLNVNFRNKKCGWNSHFETFQIQNTEYRRNTFRFFFYEHLGVRKSCSCCPYTNKERVSDITIGDYWGWSKTHQEWSDDRGVSLILVNSEKGLAMFNSASNDLDYLQTNIEDCLQPQLQTPITINGNQNEFIDVFQKKGFQGIWFKYTDEPFVKRILVKLRWWKKNVMQFIGKS